MTAGSAWFFGYVRPERRGTPLLRWSAGADRRGGVRTRLHHGPGRSRRALARQPGRLLHFALYGLMGFAATLMLATKIPLALEIARRPASGLDPELKRAVVTGLWMTAVFGTLTGVYMSQRYGQGHNVGAVGGAAPLFGWNRAGGDLRVAHFFGMHAEQVLPLTAALAAAAFGRSWARRLMFVAAIAISALTVLTFAQAVAGRPFPIG